MVSSSVLKSSDVSKAEKKSIKKSVKNSKELDLTMFQEGSKAYLQAVKYNEAIRANTQATLDYKNAVEEYTSAVREAAKTKFDNIATDFENKITATHRSAVRINRLTFTVGLHPRLYSRHTYGVQDTTPCIFIKEKRPEEVTDHSPRQRLW